MSTVKDVVCGMNIDPPTAAAQMEYRWSTGEDLPFLLS